MTTKSALPRIRDPETLRAYARILELPRRDPVSGAFVAPGEIMWSAAEALRFAADEIEIMRDWDA